MDRKGLERLTSHTEVKAEKIRILFDAGATRSEIADFINITYQHVQNVLKRSGRLGRPSQPTSREVVQDLWTVTVGRNGRVELPAQFLDSQGIADGDTLVCRGDGEGLRVMTRSSALEMLREAARERMPAEAALLDVLINDAEPIRRP